MRNICLILPDIVKRLTNKTHMMQFAYSPVAALAFIKSDMPNFIKFFFSQILQNVVTLMIMCRPSRIALYIKIYFS